MSPEDADESQTMFLVCFLMHCLITFLDKHVSVDSRRPGVQYSYMLSNQLLLCALSVNFMINAQDSKV